MGSLGDFRGSNVADPNDGFSRVSYSGSRGAVTSQVGTSATGLCCVPVLLPGCYHAAEPNDQPYA